MARIFISFLQPIVDGDKASLFCYYEGLAKELVRCGNQVLFLNTAWCFSGEPHARMLQEVVDFDPELIVTFNNQISSRMLKKTNCPVLLVDADTVDYFANLDCIREYNDRYFAATFYEGLEADYIKTGVAKQRVFALHQATAVQRQDVPQDKNISFIGSTFSRYNSRAADFMRKDAHRVLYEKLRSFWQAGGGDCRKFIDKESIASGLSVLDLYEMFDGRNYVLSSVLDLGLSLYGPGWMKLAGSNYALASACERFPVFSLDHNQEIYNSSKINLSVSHPQTRGNLFPWRVYDIMASGGVLVSSRADLLRRMTSGHVDVPMYGSPFEARELCRKYLQDDVLRKDVVAASNAFIQKHGRWGDNFEKIGEVTGLNLMPGGMQGEQKMVGCYPRFDWGEKCGQKIKNGVDIFLFLVDSIVGRRLFLSQRKIHRLRKLLERVETDL